LVAGDLRIPFSSVKWTKQGETLTLIFTLKQLDAEALAEGARVEAADLRVALQLSSGQKGAQYGDGTEVETKLAPGVGSSKDKGKLPEVDDMLELPVLAAPLDRPTLPYAMRTAIFGDPAYDRSLASRPQSEERAVKSQDREHGFLFGIDRASHDLGSAIYLAAGEVDRADGAPPKWGPATGWTFLLSVQLQPYDPSVPIPPPARPLRLAKKGASETDQGDVWYNFDPRRRYAIPVAALYESGPMDKDGRTPPAVLRPGDRLVLRVQVSRMTEQVDLRAETLLTVEPSVGTPEAVYSLLDVIGEKAPLHTRVALHAPGPMPRRVEFPDFLGDLLDGHIRRRALFIWHEVDLAPLDGSTRHSTLVKFDLSGGGQLPMDPSDFDPPLEGVGA
jgi:hypothetical protein